jgi:hypothetical protein
MSSGTRSKTSSAELPSLLNLIEEEETPSEPEEPDTQQDPKPTFKV